MSGALAALSGSGGLGGTVSVSDQNAESVVPSPALATASYGLANDGTASVNGSTVENYCNPTSIAGLLEAKITVNSGSLSGSATGSWIALSSGAAWFIQQSGVGLNAASGTVEIREAATGIVRDSATISFYAEVFA